MKYIHDDYLHWSGNGPTWQVTIDAPKRQVGTYYEETVIAAEMIWAQKVGELYLCYSGGLDSEYALAIFRSLGMKITPVIMITEYNHPETEYALKYCKHNNIKPVIINLDYNQFVESGELLRICTSMKSAAYQLASNMWLISQIDGTVITGDSDPHLIKLNDEWLVDEIEPVYSQFNYFKDNRICGTPFFMSYTCEQYTAFLTDPIIKKLANNSIPGKLGSYSSKIHVYNNNPYFKFEDRVKKTGYEVVESSAIYNHRDIQTVNSWRDKWWGSSNHEYHDLIKRLTNGQY